MIKIIFSDMDGTLLDENSQLPAGFDDMIVKLKERDIIFAPTSGRQYFSLLKSFEKYKEDFIFVAENGAIVMYQGEEIFSNPMPRDTALEILSAGKGFSDVLRVYCGKKNAYLLEDQYKQEYLDELSKYFTRNESVKSFEDIDDIPLKMSFCDINGKSAETIYPVIKEKFSATMQVVLASDYWTDVINPDVNKGTAIKKIQEGLAITPDNCAAFGDYLNDVQMLQAVTYSFAMANAHPDLKKFAKYETVSNAEHGVLVGIQKLIDEGLI